MLQMCRNFSRGILVFTNVLFVLLGAVLISIGGYLINVPDLHAFSPSGIAGVILCCGLMIFFIAVLGCCGAQCDSKLFLCPYATLIVLSIVAQLVLAGLMFHMHESLEKILDSDQHLLPPSEQKMLSWVEERFDEAYDNCGPNVNYGQSLSEQSIVLHCRDSRYRWFEAFTNDFCKLRPQDLQSGSSFLKVQYHAFTFSNEYSPISSVPGRVSISNTSQARVLRKLSCSAPVNLT